MDRAYHGLGRNPEARELRDEVSLREVELRGRALSCQSPSATKPAFVCEPSQKGLSFDLPHRQSHVCVPRATGCPVPVQTSRLPTTFSGPSFTRVISSRPSRTGSGSTFFGARSPDALNSAAVCEPSQ